MENILQYDLDSPAMPNILLLKIDLKQRSMTESSEGKTSLNHNDPPAALANTPQQ